MARILVTGSTDGVGRATAASLLEEGHDVVIHARSERRLEAVRDLLARGAASVLGDLAVPEEVEGLAEQAGRLGPFDAVIHNAGVIEGPDLLQVNVLAPYALTALVPALRLIYLSSSMHRGGRADLAVLDRSGRRGSASYSDSKLLVTALMAGIARRRPDLVAHAVDPGWVPTKMGGPSASDDLALAHLTQTWLAVADDPAALDSGGYWHHRRLEEPDPAVREEGFQEELLGALSARTGLELPAG